MADTQPTSVGVSPSDFDALVDRLAAHRTVGPAPRAELEWLAAHGHLRSFAVGEAIGHKAERIDEMFVILAGRISIFFDQGGSRHKFLEWRAGDVTGLLPYSRLLLSPGDSQVEEWTEVLSIPREELPAMTRDCHELTTILVHVMLDRARAFTSTMLHDEKLRSLGKLAAGLAHELNNPAAAIKRSAKILPRGVAAMESASRAVGAAGLTAEELDEVALVRDACAMTPISAVASPLEEARREDALADWLAAHGLDGEAADALAPSPVTLEALERLAGSLRAEVLEPALRWVAADCSVRSLAVEIDQAATRISDLVTAVRGFTQVDVGRAPQAVNVADGLRQTLAVLRGKAREKSVGTSVVVEDGLPPVRGVAAELNQIWSNLIDNALDAVPESGSVEVLAGREGTSVIVRVIDNGSGIPEDVRGHIFDPFFTTKDVGKGTGLGLDIVRRLVARHDGDIRVESRPGRTEFSVVLPTADGG
jgi:signal transduction histidine kinase